MTREDEVQIDALVRRFYGAFDNRAGKMPEIDALASMFIPDARITRVSSADPETWSFEAFAAPRVAILCDGTLTDFHEWEIDGSTVAGTTIACRRSVYRKAGILHGQPYEGGGNKLIHLCRVAGAWLISAVLWEDTD